MKTLPPIPEDQFQALAGLIDAGVRATGIRSVKDAAAIVDWLEAATDAPAEDTEQKEPE